MKHWTETVMLWIEVAGVAIIALGLLLATVGFVAAWRTSAFEAAYRTYRRRLGQAILLGLELLVAADIIGTVAVEPTIGSVSVLGLIVLVRTFLSMTLEIEMEGRLPWRREKQVDYRASS